MEDGVRPGASLEKNPVRFEVLEPGPGAKLVTAAGILAMFAVPGWAFTSGLVDSIWEIWGLVLLVFFSLFLLSSFLRRLGLLKRTSRPGLLVDDAGIEDRGLGRISWEEILDVSPGRRTSGIAPIIGLRVTDDCRKRIRGKKGILGRIVDRLRRRDSPSADVLFRGPFLDVEGEDILNLMQERKLHQELRAVAEAGRLSPGPDSGPET